MTKKIVNSKEAPTAIGPYSHAVLAGDTLYVSGQLGINPVDGQLKTTVSEQAEQAFINLGAILKESGMTFDNVVKTTVFITDMKDFPTINLIYGKYFTTDFPARSCVAVAKLPLDGLFEIEVVAVK